MEVELVCKEIPIELWGIIVQQSSSSVRCIIRSVSKCLKTWIETHFPKYLYRLSPYELLSKASQKMFDWCIKYAFTTKKICKKKRSSVIYSILISEDSLERIKQLYDYARPMFGGRHGIRGICLREHSKIINYFVKKSCLDYYTINYL